MVAGASGFLALSLASLHSLRHHLDRVDILEASRQFITPTTALTGVVLEISWAQVVMALSFVLLLAAFGVWLFERKANAEQFGGSPARGLGAAFWWSAVTMTTVGYGDKAPQTKGGRLVVFRLKAGERARTVDIQLGKPPPIT